MKIFLKIIDKNIISYFPTSTPRRIDVDSMSILRRYVEDQISTNFYIISTNFFAGISLLFPRTFLNVISMVEKSTLFLRFFFGVVSLVKKSTLFPLTFFDVTLMVEKSTLFARIFLTKFWWAKTRRRFWFSCKLMKTFEKVFLCE